MKLKLNKKKLKNLSNDNKALPADMTPQVAAGVGGVLNSVNYPPTSRCEALSIGDFCTVGE